MSSFASRVQKTIDLPNDPPHTVVIRKLRRDQLRAAELKRYSEFVETTRQQFGDKVVDDVMAEAAKRSLNTARGER